MLKEKEILFFLFFPLSIAFWIIHSRIKCQQIQKFLTKQELIF